MSGVAIINEYNVYNTAVIAKPAKDKRPDMHSDKRPDKRQGKRQGKRPGSPYKKKGGNSEMIEYVDFNDFVELHC